MSECKFKDDKEALDSAGVLLKFIESFTASVEAQAKVFKGVKEFKNFKELAKRVGMDKTLDLVALQTQVFKNNPILLLTDLGGSIMCRTSELIPNVKLNFQIKKHFHYFRPLYD